MSTEELLDVWELDEDIVPAQADALVNARRIEPRFRGDVLAAGPRLLTVQVVAGQPSDGARRFYVEHYGDCRLVRRERWPPASSGGGDDQVVLVLSRLR